MEVLSLNTDWRGGNGGQVVSMDGSLPRLGNLISVPKEPKASRASLPLNLPPVNVSQKVSAGNNTLLGSKESEQSITKASTEDTPARVKINYLARDKALSILQQYNSIVADDTSLAVRNLPPVKVSIRAKGSKPEKRPSDRPNANKQTAPVFTEGISSISTRQGPSFLVSKESVLRANLPDDVSLAQHNNQFAFNIKQKRRKHVVKDGVGTSQYKQLKMLGFDSLPPVDLGEYMRKQLLQKKSGSKGEGQHINMSGKSSYGSSSIRRFDKQSVGSSVSATPDTYRSGRQALKTSLKSKVDTRLKRKNPTKVSPTYQGSNYRGDRLNIVSIGQNKSSLLDNSSPRRFVPGTYPQFDWRARVHEEYRRLKFVPVDPSLNGVCSLAPIKVGLHHQELPPLNFTDDVPKRFSSYDGVRRIFRDDVFGDKSNPFYRRNLYNRAIGRVTSANSTSTSTSNSNHVINPPPSFVSSSDDETWPKQVETIREMQPLKEENPSVVSEHAPTSKHADLLKTKKQNSPVLTPREIVEKNRVAKPRKQQSVGNVVTLGTDLAPVVSENKSLTVPPGGSGSLPYQGGNGFLSPPVVSMMNEARPPMIGESEAKQKRNGEEEDSMYSDPSADSNSQKVTVHTVQLLPDQIPARPNVTSVTPVISVTSDSGVNEPVVFRDSDSEDSFGAYNRKMALTSKNVQFVSPLDPGQGVAKRQ
ncbi:uncharacterized protein LOC132549450 [Ylistrum balloti]|uniref:uncharacterized protein LOC132549450 n=1 Tax=Ylistrum balloti TaxID=509963 RepID=UPI00290593FA|nr:uncharacterized protein LOC132549450 [Ylistrum balloti]